MRVDSPHPSLLAFRDFCRVDLGRERVPDATTLLKFRHLLKDKKIGAALFAKVGQLLQANGMKLSGGTIVDATLLTGSRVLTRQRNEAGVLITYGPNILESYRRSATLCGQDFEGVQARRFAS